MAPPEAPFLSFSPPNKPHPPSPQPTPFGDETTHLLALAEGERGVDTERGGGGGEGSIRRPEEDGDRQKPAEGEGAAAAELERKEDGIGGGGRGGGKTARGWHEEEEKKRGGRSSPWRDTAKMAKEDSPAMPKLRACCASVLLHQCSRHVGTTQYVDSSSCQIFRLFCLLLAWGEEKETKMKGVPYKGTKQ